MTFLLSDIGTSNVVNNREASSPICTKFTKIYWIELKEENINSNLIDEQLNTFRYLPPKKIGVLLQRHSKQQGSLT